MGSGQERKGGRDPKPTKDCVLWLLPCQFDGKPTGQRKSRTMIPKEKAERSSGVPIINKATGNQEGAGISIKRDSDAFVETLQLTERWRY
jgi:hypothetical protein